MSRRRRRSAAWRSGVPAVRPAATPSGSPTDLTQEEHLDGLPIGTRGGALVHYTFPLDGEYEITIRLARDRDEHVEGLNEPHELELLLDRERRAAVHGEAAAAGAGFSEAISRPTTSSISTSRSACR